MGTVRVRLCSAPGSAGTVARMLLGAPLVRRLGSLIRWLCEAHQRLPLWGLPGACHCPIPMHTMQTGWTLSETTLS